MAAAVKRQSAHYCLIEPFTTLAGCMSPDECNYWSKPFTAIWLFFSYKCCFLHFFFGVNSFGTVTPGSNTTFMLLARGTRRQSGDNLINKAFSRARGKARGMAVWAGWSVHHLGPSWNILQLLDSLSYVLYVWQCSETVTSNLPLKTQGLGIFSFGKQSVCRAVLLKYNLYTHQLSSNNN